MRQHLAGLDAVVGPLHQRTIRRQRAVVRLRRQRDVGELEPAAGGEVVKAPLHEFGPVRQAAREHAAVDEVEGLGEGPVFFEVVDVEGEVGGDAGEGLVAFGRWRERGRTSRVGLGSGRRR